MDKNSKIKALFFDIDGTLVSFQTHRIPQSTVEALEKAKQNGVSIYISTGRPIILITNLGQIEHLIDGYITTNGARCFVENHIVCQYHVLLLGVGAYVAQKGALARAGLAREKYRAVGVLYHGPGVLKLRVVEIDVL